MIYFDILYPICLLATGTRDREAGPMEIPDLAAAGKARGAQDPFTDQDHQDVMLLQDSINLKVKGHYFVVTIYCSIMCHFLKHSLPWPVIGHKQFFK